jgi:hypothetical protein
VKLSNPMTSLVLQKIIWTAASKLGSLTADLGGSKNSKKRRSIVSVSS